MNKYLTKIAAKYDLEPGVSYDDQKHAMRLNNDKRKEIDDRHKTIGGVSLGGVYAGIGAGVGATMGITKKRNILAHLATSRGMEDAVNHVVSMNPVKRNLLLKLPHVGGVVGAVGLGALGYGLGRWSASQPAQLKVNRDSKITELEKKYQKTIYGIHGWND